MFDELMKALMAQQQQPQEPVAPSMGPAIPGTALPDSGAPVMEAGVPTLKGAMARMAPAAYDAAAEINPQALKNLMRQSKPIFDKLKAAGQFVGDRTTGSGMSEIAKRLQAMQAPAESLGGRLAEYAPVGGESTINALRPAAARTPSIVEQAYQRLLMNGGR